jgi:vitamin B12 transporter
LISSAKKHRQCIPVHGKSPITYESRFKIAGWVFLFFGWLSISSAALAGNADYKGTISQSPGLGTPTPLESTDISTTTDTLLLNPVVVTATKIPASQRETAKPVTVIDRETIDLSPVRDLARLLNLQSGLRVNDIFGSPANNRSLRMQGAGGAYTLILIDGLAINDPSGVGGVFDMRLLPLQNIEQIEILKGSQSTLYGTDAVAGVVNLITRQPDSASIRFHGDAAYGAWNTRQASLGASGTLRSGSLPTTGYTIRYRNQSTDGFSAAARPDGAPEFGSDGYSSDSFSADVRLQSTRGFTLAPFLNITRYQGDFDDGAFQDADNSLSIDVIHTGVRTGFQSGNLRLTAGYNATLTERSFETGFGTFEYEGVMHNADIFADYRAGDYLHLLSGINLQDTRLPGRTTGLPTASSSLISPYTTIYLRSWNGVNAQLGARLNHHSEYGQNLSYTIAPSWIASPWLKLFASYSTGFKTPTLNELFGPFGPNPDLKPQNSRYLNGGGEVFLLGESLTARALYFHREVDDVIVYVFPQGYINRDLQRNSGMEVSATYTPGSRVTLSGWYNYTTGEIRTLDAAGAAITRGNLIRVPAHAVGLNVFARPIPHLRLLLDASWNGKRDDLYFNPATFTNDEVELDAYLLVNIAAEYRLASDRIGVFADITNLFNSSFTEVYGYETGGLSLQAGLRVAL